MNKPRAAITYEPLPTPFGYSPRILVRLDGKQVGRILKNADGWFYKPKGRAAGQTMQSPDAVKRSLEAEQ